MLTTEQEYKAGKTAGILAATDRDPERRHTTRDEALYFAAAAKHPATLLQPEKNRRDRAYWLGYLRGIREWDEVLRETWQQLRRDGSTRMTFEQYRACS